MTKPTVKPASAVPQESQNKATCARPVIGEWPSDAITESEAKYRAEVRQHLSDVTRGPDFHRSLLIEKAKMKHACPQQGAKIDWSISRPAIKGLKTMMLPDGILAIIERQVVHGQAIMELLRVWAEESGGLVGLVDGAIRKQRLALLESMGLIPGRDWYLARESR